jgi:hypothetical protein
MSANAEDSVSRNSDLAKGSVKWIAITGACLLGSVYLFWLFWGFNYDDRFTEIMYEHMAAVLGVPGSIIVAFVIVSVLENVSGPVKFQGLGFKFEGASGPIVMWVIVFLSLVSGLKLLW